MPRVDRRPRQRLDAQARRTAILQAAGAAFTAEPYDRVSVARVAEAAQASEALVHRYFGSKSGLYVAVVHAGITKLLERQQCADAALGAQATIRERVSATVRIYLDVVTEWSVGWLTPLRSPGGEPAEARTLRRQNREFYVTALRDLLMLPPDHAADYALHGYLGFLDAACLAWAERGYPHADREHLTDQAISALAGALTAAGQPGILHDRPT
jgi:AcrR family transcriptional regulator